jgi:nucleoside-diphosphate-sugar epimerase
LAAPPARAFGNSARVARPCRVRLHPREIRKPALATGGAGYIGSHFALTLLDRGEKVVALDDLSAGNAALVPAAARLVVGDVGDSARLAELFARHRLAAIAHFAARFSAIARTPPNRSP